MRGTENTDLFDPKTQMYSDFTRHGSSSDGDFGFAFNDSNFSDRLLRIEIMGGPSDSRSDAEGCTSIADWAHHRKRRTEDIKKESVTISDIVACAEEQILTDEQPDMDGCPGGDNLDDEGEEMVEEALSGDDEDTSLHFDGGASISRSNLFPVSHLRPINGQDLILDLTGGADPR